MLTSCSYLTRKDTVALKKRQDIIQIENKLAAIIKEEIEFNFLEMEYFSGPKLYSYRLMEKIKIVDYEWKKYQSFPRNLEGSNLKIEDNLSEIKIIIGFKFKNNQQEINFLDVEFTGELICGERFCIDLDRIKADDITGLRMIMPASLGNYISSYSYFDSFKVPDNELESVMNRELKIGMSENSVFLIYGDPLKSFRHIDEKNKETIEHLYESLSIKIYKNKVIGYTELI